MAANKASRYSRHGDYPLDTRTYALDAYSEQQEFVPMPPNSLFFQIFTIRCLPDARHGSSLWPSTRLPEVRQGVDVSQTRGSPRVLLFALGDHARHGEARREGMELIHDAMPRSPSRASGNWLRSPSPRRISTSARSMPSGTLASSLSARTTARCATRCLTF
jgi:hypothetical protein